MPDIIINDINILLKNNLNLIYKKKYLIKNNFVKILKIFVS